MKILSQINVFNSEEYLWYVLKSIYYHVDRIVVIDGAFRDVMPSKYSTDRTRNIVEGFEDKEKKIIYIRVHSNSQKEQRNKIFDFVSGMDWLLLVDDDEVYKERDLVRLRRFLESTGDVAFKIRGYNFVNCFGWYYMTDNMRVWKIKKGMKYIGSNNIGLVNNESYYDRNFAKLIRKVIRFHYSYVRDIERLKIKRAQIEEFQRGKEWPWRRNGQYVVRNEWNKRKFTGSHPKIMKKHPYRSRKWNPE